MRMVASSRSPHAGLPAAFREEETFYARYAWCLNPILTFEELLRRLREELDAASATVVPWQRAEARINVYLFVCAIACIGEDYLSAPLADLAPVAAHFPRLGFAVRLAERLLGAVHTVRTAVVDRSLASWRHQWTECVDTACEILLHESEPSDHRWTEFDSRVRALALSRFPARLLGRRMLLPAAFRNQDLTHHDVTALARRVAASQASASQPLVVIGLRTAGMYFAPLLTAHLAACRVPASWTTIRPKEGLSRWEHRQLRSMCRSGAHVVVVDEPPDSGVTLRLAFALLARVGISADRITVAMPRSPAKADWALPAGSADAPRPQLITLDPPDYHKARLLKPEAFAPLLREYWGSTLHFQENAEVDALNTTLRAHHRDGFHVRLKRVFEVGCGTDRPGAARRIVAKSVGWGWLGYHAYIAGSRLAGLVPRVIGLRHGLLVAELVGRTDGGGARSAPDITVPMLASYTAIRARRLRMAEDPCFEDFAYARTGWRELVNLLRRAYGLYVGRFKIPILHRRLRNVLSPVPALIDGRIEPEEWVANEEGTFKADFEHHNFGKTELNVVDPAYDLAYATFAFALSPEQERQLVEVYSQESSDPGVRDRILLYTLLHGAVVMTHALSRVSGDPSEARHEWNRRYLAARRFLTSQFNRFAASRIPRPAS
ncbi:MAG TPA: hypothetical protein VH137_10405, partial [Gemmatimonadales bacterium]|nr:hypothetical protein [Gemmatimonadales bacterium]